MPREHLVEGAHLIEPEADVQAFLLRTAHFPPYVRRQAVPRGVRVAGTQIEEARDLAVGDGQVHCERFPAAQLEQIDPTLPRHADRVRH